MCCIFCEEPVRSVTLSLAAMGIVAVVNGARRVWNARAAREGESQQAIEPALPVGDGTP